MDKDAKSARKVYDKFAETFVKGQNKYKDRAIISRALVQLIGDVKNKKVLDVGCGAGVESRLLAKRGANVIGIDISEKMLNIARENCSGLNVKFLVHDFEKTSFDKNKFDMILAAYSVDYKENLEKVLKEFHRILKPGGEVVLVVAHPIRKMMRYGKFNYFLRGKHWETKKWSGTMLKYKRFGYYRTLGEYVNSIVSSGFRIIKVVEPKPVMPKKIKEELTNQGVTFPKTLWYPYALVVKFKK